MSIAEKKVHKSRWGYHPCSREECAKLKEYHKILFRAIRDNRKWDRWARKLNPQYPEPKCSPMWETDYYNILEIYQKARRPVLSPDLVEHYEMPEGIAGRIAGLQRFYDE